MSDRVCTLRVGGLCGQPATEILHVRNSQFEPWEEHDRCPDHPAKDWVPIIKRVSPMAEIRIEKLTPVPANGGIDCTCGHTIVEDGTCCCPDYCPTCSPEDCCAEAWASYEASAAVAQ